MKILRGTVFGGIAYFVLGWVIYGILLLDWTMNNFNDCAARSDGVMIWWAMIAASLVLALFLTLVMKWSGAKGIAGGLKTGLVFGLLFGLSVDLAQYSMSTAFNNLWVAMADVVIWAIILAFVGLVIALTWGKEKTS